MNLASHAFGTDVFMASEFKEDQLRKHLTGVPARTQDIFNRTARQIIELRRALESYYVELKGQRAGTRAGELVARLLGIPTERAKGRADADDRSAGYPLRRFAEFGVLPGYEFPTEPASLRLLGDENEEDPVSVARRFGITQFQPDAQVYARTKRWRVIGLDLSSPWNPRTDEPSGDIAPVGHARFGTMQILRSVPGVGTHRLRAACQPWNTEGSSRVAMRIRFLMRKKVLPLAIEFGSTLSGTGMLSGDGTQALPGPSV
jgi:hypothetical protein